MHAVVVNVTLNDPEAAGEALLGQVVPRVAESPGFVAGYWLELEGNRGMSVVLYESAEAAKAAASQAGPPGSAVTFDSVEVAGVVASA